MKICNHVKLQVRKLKFTYIKKIVNDLIIPDVSEIEDLKGKNK